MWGAGSQVSRYMREWEKLKMIGSRSGHWLKYLVDPFKKLKSSGFRSGKCNLEAKLFLLCLA
jgi:hypothetical protein